MKGFTAAQRAHDAREEFDSGHDSMDCPNAPLDLTRNCESDCRCGGKSWLNAKEMKILRSDLEWERF